MRQRAFDWYGFLGKKLLRFERFDADGVVVNFSVSGEMRQGGTLQVHFLLRNSWTCPVRARFQVRIRGNCVWRPGRAGEKIAFPREFNVGMRPGEIVKLSIPGHVASDCKRCILDGLKVKVRKEGKGKRLFGRKDRPLKAGMGPLNLLLLPFGILSWSGGPRLDLPIQKYPEAGCEPRENQRDPGAKRFSLWSLDRPSFLDLRPCFSQSPERDSLAMEEIREFCVRKYQAWAARKGAELELEVAV